MPYEPVIVGFLCNWCSYSGADKAGQSRVGFPQNLRAIRVMCSGRVEPELVLKAFHDGADGVIICGCHPGDCHYISGNRHAKARFLLLSRVISEFGIPDSRCRLEWVSASEGDRYISVVTDMTEKLRPLGPLALVSPHRAKSARLQK